MKKCKLFMLPVIDAHSQGGIILGQALRYLSSEERAMLYVSTYGSATLIHDSALKGCVNYVSRADLIPLIGDPMGYMAAKIGLRPDVQFVHSGGKGAEHRFSCATYQEALSDDAREFKRFLLQ
jgi:hypothetical protein